MAGRQKGFAPILGELSLKITPDLTGFEEYVEAYMKNVERGLDKLKVDFTPDTTGMLSESNRAIDGIEAMLNEIDVKLGIDPDGANIAQAKAALATLSEDFGKIDIDTPYLTNSAKGAWAKAAKDVPFKKLINTEVDTRTLEDSMNQALANLPIAIKDIETKVKTNLDTASVQRVNSELSAILDEHKTVHIDTQLDIDGFKLLANVLADSIADLGRAMDNGLMNTSVRSIRDLEGAVSAAAPQVLSLTGRIEKLGSSMADGIINLAGSFKAGAIDMAAGAAMKLADGIGQIATRAATVSVGQFSGFNYLVDFLQKKAEIVANFDQLTIKMGQFFTAGSAAVAVMGNMIGFAGSLAVDLKNLALGAVALPGIFASIGAGAAVAAIAFMDWQQRFPGLNSELEKTKALMQDSFWQNAADSVQAATEKLMPLVQATGQIFSGQLGALFGAAVDSASDRLSAAWPRLTDRIMRGWQELGRVIDPIMDAAEALLDTGTKAFESLAPVVADLAIDVANWITKMGETGQLDQMWKDSVQVLKDLWGAAVGAYDTITGIGEAFKLAGGPGLKEFAEGIQTLGDNIKGPWKDDLEQFFKNTLAFTDGIGKGIPGLLDFGGALNKTFKEVAPEMGGMIGDTIDKWASAFASPATQNGIKLFSDGIVKGMDKLNESAPLVAAKFEDIGGLAGKMSEKLGGLTGELFKELAESLKAMRPELDRMMDNFFPIVEGLVQKIGPQFTDKIIEFLKKMNDNPERMQKVADALGTIALSLVDMGLWAADKGFEVAAFFSDVIKFFESPTGKFISGLAGEAIMAAPMAKLFALPFNWTETQAAFGEMGKQWDELQKKFSEGAEIVNNAVTSMKDRVSGVFSGLWNGVTVIVSAMWADLTSQFGVGGADILGSITETGRKIGEALKDLASVAWNAGVEMFTKLKEGIMSMAQPVIDAANFIMEKIRGLFPNSPAQWGPFGGSNWIDGSGESIMTTFMEGLKSIAPDLNRELMSAIGPITPQVSVAPAAAGFGNLTNVFNLTATGTDQGPSQFMSDLFFETKRRTRGGLY